MVNKPIASITGYIPELEYKMTPAEMNDYVLLGSQDPDELEDTDIIPRDYETTQAELTPMSSSGFSSLKISDIDKTDTIEKIEQELPTVDTDQGIAMEEDSDGESTDLVSDASEETVTASMSADEIVVLQPLQEISHPLDRKLSNLQHQQPHGSSLSSSAGSASPNNKFVLSSDSIGILNEKLQQLQRHQHEQHSPSSSSSCSVQQTRSQRKTDSESSDGERVCIEQIA